MRRNAAALMVGLLACSALPVGVSAVFAAPATADAISQSTARLLSASALDARRGDDGVTPVAVADGDQVYGARASAIPTTADVAAFAGKSYFVDCAATANGDGSKSSPFNSLDAANALTRFS